MAAGVTVFNQNLKPERSKNIEIGAAAYKTGLFSTLDKGSVRVAYFKNDIHQFISRYYTDTLEMRNSDRYKVSGMELQLNYDTGKYFVDFAATRYFKAQTCDKATAAFLNENEFHRQLAPDCTEGGFRGSYVNTQPPLN